MSARDCGGPAFPMPDLLLRQAMEALEAAPIPDAKKDQLAEEIGSVAGGMSLRDYFAAKAMQGFMANKANPMHFQPHDDAAWAYSIADAMLKAREA
jgi:hypothetical protein